MNRSMKLVPIALGIALAAGLAAPPASAEDYGKTIGDAFTGAFKGLKEGVLDAYETSTKGAKEKWNDVTGKQPGEAAVAPAPAAPADLVAEVQGELALAGYQPGKLDGVYGPQTAEAVRAYQYNNQLPTDGQVSMALLDHMRNKRMTGQSGGVAPRGYGQSGAVQPTSPSPAPSGQTYSAAPPPRGAGGAPTSQPASQPTGAMPALPGAQTPPAQTPTAQTPTAQAPAAQPQQPQAQQQQGDSNCRPYESRMMVQGKEEVSRGTACLQADGTWKRVN